MLLGLSHFHSRAHAYRHTHAFPPCTINGNHWCACAQEYMGPLPSKPPSHTWKLGAQADAAAGASQVVCFFTGWSPTLTNMFRFHFEAPNVIFGCRSLERRSICFNAFVATSRALFDSVWAILDPFQAVFTLKQSPPDTKIHHSSQGWGIKSNGYVAVLW